MVQGLSVAQALGRAAIATGAAPIGPTAAALSRASIGAAASAATKAAGTGADKNAYFKIANTEGEIDLKHNQAGN